MPYYSVHIYICNKYEPKTLFFGTTFESMKNQLDSYFKTDNILMHLDTMGEPYNDPEPDTKWFRTKIANDGSKHLQFDLPRDTFKSIVCEKKLFEESNCWHDLIHVYLVKSTSNNIQTHLEYLESEDCFFSKSS